MTRRPETDGPEAGVWNSADAPDGYVALVVFSSRGRRLLRLEVATDAYSNKWVPWLERWLLRRDRRRLRMVK
jgi:hypothetical protein